MESVKNKAGYECFPQFSTAKQTRFVMFGVDCHNTEQELCFSSDGILRDLSGTLLKPNKSNYGVPEHPANRLAFDVLGDDNEEL
jgi:hypothetical protein